MAFGRLERTPGALPMSDINMTPLIDVMLVLLVIFMITAPLMTLEPQARPAQDRRGAAERHAAVHQRRARSRRALLLRRRGRRRRGVRCARRSGGEEESADRSAAARRQGRALRTRRRADRHRAESRADAGSASSPTPRSPSGACGRARPRALSSPASCRRRCAGAPRHRQRREPAPRRSSDGARTGMLEPVRYSVRARFGGAAASDRAQRSRRQRLPRRQRRVQRRAWR